MYPGSCLLLSNNVQYSTVVSILGYIPNPSRTLRELLDYGGKYCTLWHVLLRPMSPRRTDFANRYKIDLGSTWI